MRQITDIIKQWWNSGKKPPTAEIDQPDVEPLMTTKKFVEQMPMNQPVDVFYCRYDKEVVPAKLTKLVSGKLLLQEKPSVKLIAFNDGKVLTSSGHILPTHWFI